MKEKLTAVLILTPFIAACLCLVIRSVRGRSLVVAVTCALLVASALGLAPVVPFTLIPDPRAGRLISNLISGADFLLLAVVLYFGFLYRSRIIIILTLFQILGAVYLELSHPMAPAAFSCDGLSLIMVLIVSIPGSIICLQATAYMKAHEAHLNLQKSAQPGFFATLFLFLGAMNGLVLSAGPMAFYFFFELTTLCSFLLIRHDRTEVAVKNAVTALWMNSLGGAALLLGLALIPGGRDLNRLLAMGFGPGMALSLLCLAAFVKSAQFPFQGWLLGAMVAPTPVSALLHSSTMVNIGVYLIIRLAPVLGPTFTGHVIAVFGAFVFLCAAALAVGQHNGKKVLAYSTISNLGLVLACAALNSPQAMTAAILLLVFHAVTKALLFLCIGAIEQRIDSRDIEDMRGLYGAMPVTALIMVMGVIMMIMPPFGVMIGKWMALEAAAKDFFIIVLIALGSALTVMYWARWGGTLMSDPFAGRFTPEKQPLQTWTALGFLAAGTALMSIFAPWLYAWGIAPAQQGLFFGNYTSHNGILENQIGIFPVLPLGVLAALGAAVGIWALKKAARARVVPPYMSGIQTLTPGVFKGPMNQGVRVETRNMYLSSIFGEGRLLIWINLAAVLLMILVIGGAL